MGWFKKKEIAPPAIGGDMPTGVSSDKSGMDSPWFRANQAYLDTYLRLAAQVRNWQKQALLGWLLAVIAICWMGYLGAQPKIKPYVVEVDSLGRTRVVRALGENDTRIDPERIITAELRELIINLRTVTTDAQANNRNISEGLSRLSGAAYAHIKSELRKAPPNKVGESKTVQVKTYPPLKISEGTWQIEWEEQSFTLLGESMGAPERWKAVVQLRLLPNLDDEEAFVKNPYGFDGHQMNWTRI